MAGHLAPSSSDEMIRKQRLLFPNSRGKSTVQADFPAYFYEIRCFCRHWGISEAGWGSILTRGDFSCMLATGNLVSRLVQCTWSPVFRKDLTMRGMSLFLMLLAMAMFMVGCDTTPQPLPSGAPDATSGVDVDYEPPPEEHEGQPITEPAPQPVQEDPIMEAPAEPGVDATDTP
jgi:hypothetical protein